MAAPSRRESPIARGLRSVERVPGGATLYHVVFGESARRPLIGEVSFDDIERPEPSRESRVGLLVSIVAHLVLVSLPIVALAPRAKEDPALPQGITVELVADPALGQMGAPLPATAEDKVTGGPSGRSSNPAEPMLASVSEATRAVDAGTPTPGPEPVESAPVAAPVAASVPAAASTPDAAPRGVRTISPEEVRWEGAILARIEGKKRYPKAALRVGTQDIVMLRLVLDREGHVVRAEVARSGGHAPLDAEVLALARRAGPYPRPPASVAGETVALLVPVEFVLKKSP